MGSTHANELAKKSSSVPSFFFHILYNVAE